MYYPSSENKGADQLRGYREADLRLCFRICKNPVFSRRASYYVIHELAQKKAITIFLRLQVQGKFRTHGGKPGQVICRIAEEEGAAIIVCGTRGQGTVRRTIMGSVSDYIVHHSHVPVLVCRYKNKK